MSTVIYVIYAVALVYSLLIFARIVLSWFPARLGVIPAGGRRAAPPGSPRRIRHCCPQSGYLPGRSLPARVAPRPQPL